MSALVVWALLATAVASPDDHVSEEIVVLGELRVEQARQEVIDDLTDLGFTIHKDRGDHVLLRHEAAYRGQVRLYDSGWMEIERQPVRVEGAAMPWAKRNSTLAWVGCIVWSPACVKPGGVLFGQRKWRGVRDTVVGHTSRDVYTFGDRVADLAVDRTVLDLPDRLQLLWDEGQPLEGEGVLSTHESRRAAILAYRHSRTDTVWGDRVRAAVDGFIRGVVQHSEHPFTDDELAELFSR